MSLPDLLKDVNSATAVHKSPMEPCKQKSFSMNFSSSTIRSRSREESSSPDFEWESDSHSSIDEGEAAWDALGRMNSIRRSNRFDKPQLLTVQLQRTTDGFGLELEGHSPPVIHTVCGEAELKGVRQGDRILEVNGVCVRNLTHQEAGRLISGSDSVILLLHTVKPPIQPSGKVVYSGWLYKKGGSGITPRNWRKRWFILRDDCISYYYPSSEDTSRPLGAIVMHNYTISRCGGDPKKPFSFKIMKGGARTYFLAADSDTEMNQWAQVLAEAANLENREQVHISGSARNVGVSALSIKSPERHGFLYKQGRGFLSWKRTYCILKCQQMFFYTNMSQTTAQEVLNVTDYEIVTGKTKDKHYYFDAVPPTKDRKTIRFYTETEIDRVRWMEAIVKSIGDCTSIDTNGSIDSS